MLHFAGAEVFKRSLAEAAQSTIGVHFISQKIRRRFQTAMYIFVSYSYFKVTLALTKFLHMHLRGKTVEEF